MSATPESVGLSSQRLAVADRFLQERYVDKGRLKGLSYLVYRRGQLAHTAVMGLADAERGTALKDDTIVRIYSMTKPITSVAMMMLVEQGLVALDDPVSRFIPSWANLGVYQTGVEGQWLTRPCDRPMQIVDLLRHTSGLTYNFQYRTNVDAAYRRSKLDTSGLGPDLDGLIEGLGKVPLEFSPGAAWNYSVATDILGYLVGKISGAPFEVFLQERLFKPLGMVDTGFFVPPEKASRLAACYQRGADGVTLQDDPTRSRYLEPPKLVSGGGGLVSTQHDYLRFCQMVLNKGTLDGVQYLSPKTIQLMGANHLPGAKSLSDLSVSLFSEATYSGVGFGLGFATTIDQPATLIPGTKGDLWWGGMASTAFWIDPAEDLIVVFMTQLMPSAAYPIRRELRTLVYSAFTESNS
jgi:CubicO group peptidase (beta-lactamase class C family)